MKWNIPPMENTAGPFWTEWKSGKPPVKHNFIWEDISTAPKDGTSIMLSVKVGGNRYTCPASWDIVDSNFGDDVMGWCGLNGNPLTTEYTEWQPREVPHG